MFVELIERTQRHTNVIVPEGEVEIRKVRDYEAYTSMFPYGKGIIDHLKFHRNDEGKPTVSGFEGDYHCKMLWFDIDCEHNQSYSFMSACKLVNRLLNKYGLQKEHIIVFFSGGKGFHIGISAKHFGGFEPGNTLPYQIQRLAKKIIDGIEYVDDGIYNPNRFFRLPFSKHAKTGLYKMPISAEELPTLNILKIKNMATSPRIDFQFPKVAQIVKNHELEKLWTLCKPEPRIAKIERKLLEEFPTDQEAIFAKAVELTERKKQYYQGNRNNYIYLLSAYCNDLGFGESGDGQLAIERISLFLADEKAESFTDGLDVGEFESTVNSAYRNKRSGFGSKFEYLRDETNFQINEKTKLFLMDKAMRLSRASRMTRREIVEILMAFNATSEFPIKEEEVYKIANDSAGGSSERDEDDYGHTVSQLATEFYLNIINTKNEFGLGIPVIDEIEDYSYSSKLIGIIGKAGTKKSLLLKDMLIHVAKNNLRGIYSSMEDGRLGQFKRILNSSFAPSVINEGTPNEMKVGAAYSLKNMIKRAPERSKLLIERNAERLYEIYGDRLILDDKTSMGYDDYEHFIEKIISKYGSLSMLGIDGLSMMDSTGDEVKAAVENSKNAKALANKYNIAIPLLIHVPSHVGREKRALYDNTRGGSKVTDNCDILISLSQIKDNSQGDFTGDHFREDLVYVSYWGKRTTGKRKDFIMQLDPYNLTLKCTDIDPMEIDMF